MSEKKELNKRQLSKVTGGKTVVRYVCNVCSNEIPADAPQRIEEIQTYLNDPASISAKFLKKCPYCDEFVEFHTELN